MANLLITWLRSKTQVLALMRDIQERMPRDGITQVLSVIRPVATRWTAFFLAYMRLLQLLWVLQLLVQLYRNRLLSGKAASRRKAQEMIVIIERLEFWHGLVVCVIAPLSYLRASDKFLELPSILSH